RGELHERRRDSRGVDDEAAVQLRDRGGRCRGSWIDMMRDGIAEHLAQWAIAPRRRHYTELTIRWGTRMVGRGQVILHLGKDQRPGLVLGLIFSSIRTLTTAWADRGHGPGRQRPRG